MKKLYLKHGFVINIIIILFIAFIVRAIKLNSFPIFADEAIYIRWAQVMKAESTLRFLPLTDGKQPLFMWTVIPFLKLIRDPLVAGRIVSVAAGVATCLGVILITHKLFNSKKASLLSGILYALSPFAVFFDRMALVDTMLSMFGVWFVFFMLESITKKRFDYAMLAGFALGGAMLTKSTALFFLILLPTIILFTDVKPNLKKDNLIRLTKISLFWLTAFLIGFGMYNILRLGPNFHMMSLRNYDYVYPYSHILNNPLDPFMPHLKSVFEYLYLLAPISAIALFILGVKENTKKYKKQVLFLLIWFLVPLFAVMMYTIALNARYILFTLPYFFIISGASILTKDVFTKKIVYLFLGLFIIQSVIFSLRLNFIPNSLNLPRSERSGYLEEWSSGYGIRESAQYIRALHEADMNKRIVVGTEGYFGTLPDGLHLYLADHPDITVVGVGLDLTEIPNSLSESKAAGNNTYLLINSTRLKIKNPESAGLKLVASYPKAVRPTGTYEYNLYGPQEYLMLYELN